MKYEKTTLNYIFLKNEIQTQKWGKKIYIYKNVFTKQQNE